MHTDLVAALDIGGTKIAGALVDGSGRILLRAQRPTPATEGAETVMGAVEAVLAELAALTAVGAGLRGRHRQRGTGGRLRRHGQPRERSRTGVNSPSSPGCTGPRVAFPSSSSATASR